MAIDIGPVDDPVIRGVRFGRSRALALLAGIAFQLALQVASPRAAAAHVLQLPPCNANVYECHCCGSCSSPYAGCLQGQTTCWFACTTCNSMYRCCDFEEFDPHEGRLNLCTCRTFWGECSGLPC